MTLNNRNLSPGTNLKLVFMLCILVVMMLDGCYSLKSTSIDPSVTTFYVAPFDGRADNGPVTLPITFSEQLKDKIRRESRLRFVDTDPDLTFSGNIEDFNVTSQAPTADNVSALSRLTIRVHIEFENKHDDKKNWTQSFSFFQDYDGKQNLLDVQENLISIINKQIIEDIFNKAFGDW